jgi:hypothetical protein
MVPSDAVVVAAVAAAVGQDVESAGAVKAAA